MNVYANGFRCAWTEAKDEFSIQFIQQGPDFNENDAVVGAKKEVVASVVMPANIAIGLVDIISGSFSQNAPEIECTEQNEAAKA